MNQDAIVQAKHWPRAKDTSQDKPKRRERHLDELDEVLAGKRAHHLHRVVHQTHAVALAAAAPVQSCKQVRGQAGTNESSQSSDAGGAHTFVERDDRSLGDGLGS